MIFYLRLMKPQIIFIWTLEPGLCSRVMKGSQPVWTGWMITHTTNSFNLHMAYECFMRCLGNIWLKVAPFRPCPLILRVHVHFIWLYCWMQTVCMIFTVHRCILFDLVFCECAFYRSDHEALNQGSIEDHSGTRMPVYKPEDMGAVLEDQRVHLIWTFVCYLSWVFCSMVDVHSPHVVLFLAHFMTRVSGTQSAFGETTVFLFLQRNT